MQVSNHTSANNRRRPSAERQTKRKPDVHTAVEKEPINTDINRVVDQPTSNKSRKPTSNAEEGWRTDTAPS